MWEEVVVLKRVIKSPETTPILRPARVKMGVVFQPLKIEINGTFSLVFKQIALQKSSAHLPN